MNTCCNSNRKSKPILGGGVRLKTPEVNSRSKFDEVEWQRRIMASEAYTPIVQREIGQWE